MDRTICYLNTDLDLTSSADLTALVTVFESGGLFPLHVTHGDDGLWHATFETLVQHTEPEPNIAAMVAVVESLGEPHRSVWQGCTRREFNIGNDCGAEPWAFNQGLSCELLGRMAAVGASLRFTLYSDRERSTPNKTLARAAGRCSRRWARGHPASSPFLTAAAQRERWADRFTVTRHTCLPLTR